MRKIHLNWWYFRQKFSAPVALHGLAVLKGKISFEKLGQKITMKCNVIYLCKFTMYLMYFTMNLKKN